MSKTKTFKTRIDDLPNELLSQIFENLSLKDDFDHVQLACRRWHSVVNETIGREIAISTLTNGSLNVISKIGVKACFVELADCFVEEDIDSKDGWKCPTFKFPYLLKHLHLNGMIRSDVFQNLLFEAQNLAILELNLLCLSQLKASDLKNLYLPNLGGVGVRRCVKYSFEENRDELGLRNFQTLLENIFPSLTQLDIRFPILGFSDFSTLKALLKFLAVHDNLKKLYMVMEFPVQVHKVKVSEAELEILQQARKFRNCPKLESVEIQGIRLHASYLQIKLWLAFIQRQRSLKSITLRLGNIEPHDLYQICEKNGSSLENLFIYKFSETEEEFTPVILNAAVFSLTKRLETLYVLGSKLVIGANELPLTLLSIFITGAIKTEQVRHILFNLPKLKFINLKNAYDQRDTYGITLDILTEFIQTRKVKRLILTGSSLCKDLPANGFANGDPDHPAQLTSYDCWEPYEDFIDWELNASRKYFNGEATTMEWLQSDKLLY